jgi:hypothetical protein
MPVKTEPGMNAYDLAQTIEFSHLSARQAVWALTYVQNFLDTGTCDSFLATKAAYKCASDETSRIFGYQVQANPKIRLVLNRFFGDSPEQAVLKTERERLITIVRKQLKAAVPGSIAAEKFSAQLERLQLGIKLGPHVREDDNAEPEAEASSETTFHIGQLVTQRDEAGNLHTGRVMAIDSDGKATLVEEVK